MIRSYIALVSINIGDLCALQLVLTTYPSGYTGGWRFKAAEPEPPRKVPLSCEQMLWDLQLHFTAHWTHGFTFHLKDEASAAKCFAQERK